MSDDPTSQSNFLQAPSQHIDFDWTVDFDAKVISGTATHTLAIQEDNLKEIIFDTSALDISTVKVDGTDVKPYCGDNHPVMGIPLHVPLPTPPKKGSTVQMEIAYKTTENCTALQWLDKNQTQGKQYPYLFSQCQPIYMRSLAPVQDTPSVKTTYNSKVSSVLPVLMSAVRKSPPEGTTHGGKVIGKDVVTYVYEQSVPIPSYLIAIAVGNVTFRPFDQVPGKTWTSGIWAEPESIEDAYNEFKDDTTRFLAKEEEFVPPYRFHVYDMLVLPPSFPYGGMENACCTFLTPTIITGDRSLVDVVVHEMTHSWFGNGVTHANASHFWLNEGFTTYMERVLQEKLHNSPEERDFEFIIGFKGLKSALEGYNDKPKYQRLVIPFEKGEDPDDAYSEVPYEKGANFLLHLERTLGGLDVFLPYIYDYADTYTGKSITTEIWKEHLYAYFTANGGADKIKALDGVKWDEWLNGEGTDLPDEIKYNTALAQKAYDLALKWDQSRTADPTQEFQESDVKDFNSNQKVVFLQTMHDYPAFPAGHIDILGGLYQFFNSTNAEIRLVFYMVAFKDTTSVSAKKYAPEALKWVVGTDESGVIKGRMKFCRPIFQETNKIVPSLAVSTWQAHRAEFHPIAQKLIDKDLGLA